MEPFPLNKQNIEKAIDEIEKIDFNIISINEIETIINPLFTGYKTYLTKRDPGVIICRGRICEKPKTLRDLTYPAKKYVTKHGRVNDIEQQIFYGCLGKGVPFFELNANVGDRIAISTWRTKTLMSLNHVGFTDETGARLKSVRELSSAYDFIQAMNDFDDLNTFVYNYLASAFTKLIKEPQLELYKLSIAIANKLTQGDLFDGLIYPTMAAFGNADNIALKPSFVDNNLEFLSVEYLEVVKVENNRQSYISLDSAIQLNDNEEILWSGEKNFFNINEPKQSFYISDSCWLVKDQSEKFFVKRGVSENTGLSPLKERFLNDFDDCAKINQNLTLQNRHETIEVNCSLNLNFLGKKRFLSFYIPKCTYPMTFLELLVANYKYILDLDNGQIIEFTYHDASKPPFDNRQLLFSNEIFIYSEILINDIEIKSLDPHLKIAFQ